MSNEYSIDYKALSKKGLVDLCEAYDKHSDNQLNDYFYAIESYEYEVKDLSPEYDSDGNLIPIVFEQQSTISDVAENVQKTAEGIGKATNDAVSIVKAVASILA